MTTDRPAAGYNPFPYIIGGLLMAADDVGKRVVTRCRAVGGHATQRLFVLCTSASISAWVSCNLTGIPGRCPTLIRNMPCPGGAFARSQPGGVAQLPIRSLSALVNWTIFVS